MRIASLRVVAGLVAVFAAQAATASVINFSAVLSGSNEAPPNASPAKGLALVDFDTGLDTLVVNVSFAGLLGTTTASHIHCCTAAPGTGTAGVATVVPTFPGFPLGVTSGSELTTLNLRLASSYNPAYITANGGTTAAAEAALLAGMLAGESYFNIHTTLFPNGEIRAFLVASPAAVVPEPWTAGLVAIGIAAAFARRRRTRR